MSRHHEARDSRDSTSHRRRHNDDDDYSTRHSHRDERDRDRHTKQSRSSASSTSDRHRNDSPNRQQKPPAERQHDQPHRRDRDQHHRSDRLMPPPSGVPVKREQSRSPDTKAKRHRNRYANDGDDGTHEWGKPGTSAPKKEADDDAAAAAAASIEKEQPNFGLSGKLTEDTNKVNGVVLKYAEPDEARKPKRRWRLYPFKGDEALPTLYIHWQSCFLVGRDRKICDIPVDHPSCSKQHAVLQYRLVGYTREDGTKGKRVRPYVLDLESANGTYLNNQRIDARKYVEILEKDVIKFGYSSREYVMLHENSKDEDEDDDVVEESSNA